VNEQDKRKYYNSYHNLYKRLVKEFTPKVEAAMREQIKFFIDFYELHQVVGVDLIPAVIMKNALKRLYIISGLTNASKVFRSIKGQIKGVTRDDKWTWVIAEYLKSNGLNQISIDITDTLKEKIRQELLKGHAEGLGTDQIVRNLKQADFPKWMAARIVRTEMNKATNIGAMVAAADLNIQVNKEWMSATDNRTRRIPRDDYDHLHMNGIQVGFDEKFVVPSTKTIDAMLQPGDPNASVGNIVNCRCTVVFVPIKDTQGRVVSMDAGEPGRFGGSNELVSNGGGVAVMNRTRTNIFSELLRQVASIEITKFIINNILTDETN
jgi:hypothetical protein